MVLALQPHGVKGWKRAATWPLAPLAAPEPKAFYTFMRTGRFSHHPDEHQRRLAELVDTLLMHVPSLMAGSGGGGGESTAPVALAGRAAALPPGGGSAEAVSPAEVAVRRAPAPAPAPAHPPAVAPARECASTAALHPRYIGAHPP
jgi:hypothetical protein